MFARRSKRVLTTGAIAGALTLITAGAVAAAPSNPFRHDGGLLAACVGPDGDARIMRTYQHCRPGERELVWNEQGRPGIQGPTGATGGTGPQGIQGIQGVPGPSLNPTVAETSQNPPGAPSGTFADAAPALTVTLPAAGTYLISANLRGGISYTGADGKHGCFITARLTTGSPATPVPGSERMLIIDDNGLTQYADSVQSTAPIQLIMTGAAGQPVTVQIALNNWDGGTCPAIAGLIDNSDGHSTLNAVRIQP